MRTNARTHSHVRKHTMHLRTCARTRKARTHAKHAHASAARAAEPTSLSLFLSHAFSLSLSLSFSLSLSSLSLSLSHLEHEEHHTHVLLLSQWEGADALETACFIQLAETSNLEKIACFERNLSETARFMQFLNTLLEDTMRVPARACGRRNTRTAGTVLRACCLSISIFLCLPLSMSLCLSRSNTHRTKMWKMNTHTEKMFRAGTVCARAQIWGKEN